MLSKIKTTLLSTNLYSSNNGSEEIIILSLLFRYNEGAIKFLLTNLDTKDIPRITYADDHATKCPWYNQSEIQIDPFYNVWPCCHISMYGHIKSYPDDMEFDVTTLPNFGFNNLQNHDIYEILNHNWYNTVLPNAIDSGSYAVCRNNCGVR